MQKKLYIGNLSFNAKEEDLKKLFSELGNVEEVSIITDRQTGRPKGYAFVRMSNEEEAGRVLEMNEKEFMGRSLRISEAKSPGPYPSGSGSGESGYRSRPSSGNDRGYRGGGLEQGSGMSRW